MASSSPVKLIEHCKVSPTSSSPPQTSLSLLFFDLFWLRFPPNQRVFFYESPHSTTIFLSTILPKLKHSLSLTLDRFLPLAGHLTWNKNSDKPSVEYHVGDGVSLSVAESKGDFDLLCIDEFRQAELFYSLLPDLCTTTTSSVPVVAVQVTLFPNKGFSIGLSVHHAVMDGKSLSMFIHSWASICRESVVSCEMVPVFDRKVVRVPLHLEDLFLKSLLEEKGPNNKSLEMWDIKAPSGVILGTFKLGFSDLEKLKKSVRSRLGQEQDQKLLISTFTITSAFMWVCLSRTHKITSEKVRLAINVDSRARLDPVVPSNYFGNCIAACFVDINTTNLIKEEGVSIAARAIAEALMKLDDTILEGAENWMPELCSVQSLYSIAGSPRFELYKAGFGWGNPKKVEMISIARSGAFYLSDDRDGNGGIEIGVALKEHEAEDFAFIFASELEAH